MTAHSISIADKKCIAKDTWELTFQCLETGTLNIETGQYMCIVIPEITGGTRENSRIFSVILPYPMFRFRESKHWGVVFRASGSAFKQHLINAPIGAKMLAYGPFGDFTLPPCLDSRNLNIGWVAGGVGIAPFLSMARCAAEEKLPHRITLFYANKDRESAAYLPELAELEKRNHNFSVRLKFGAIDKELLQTNKVKMGSGAFIFNRDPIKAPDPIFYYIAGPMGMVNEVKKILAEMGVQPAQIKCEIFG